MALDGLKEVTRNLNRQIDEIDGSTMDGLLEAGLKVEGSSKSRVPVDTGNLKGSAYTRKAQGGGKAVEIGHTANYAIYVHEDMNARHTVGQPKFLESALRDNEGKIVQIIRQKARVR